MASQKGRDVLLKIADPAAPTTFVTVAGVRAKTIRFNAQTVDATTADSPAAWRELLAGAGVKSCSVTGAGVFKDAASDAIIREAFFDAAPRTWRLIVPDFGTFEGPFLVENLDYAGDHDAEASFSITLASSGALQFTAATP